MYYVIQFFVFAGMLLFALAATTAVVPGAISDGAFIINTVVQTTYFIILTHLIRVIFKSIIKSRDSKKRSALLLLALALAGSLTYSFLKPPKLETRYNRDELSFKIETPNGTHKYSEQAALGSFFMTNLVFFLLWTLSYRAITVTRARRWMLKELQRQQLENLKAQINPHFLFNSMNTIRAMIYEDKDKAAELVTQLSELFRYNLSSGVKTYTTLKEEIEVCQNYLSIEQIRLGSRLRVDWSIPTELINQRLPGMALFTLIENAVKHGIAQLPAGGVIKVEGNAIGQYWQLSVHNPITKKHSTADGTKTGLNNLERRLALMAEKQTSLNTQTNQQNFIVQVRMPYEH